MPHDPPSAPEFETLLAPDRIDNQAVFEFLFHPEPSQDIVVSDWWDQAFSPVPLVEHPKLRTTMLYLVAYDITTPKRLTKIAKTCEDFGIRVQYSLFECRLKPDHFQILWERLNLIINPEEDRIVAYQLDTDNAARTLTAGVMNITSPVVCYLI
jgi:CRISPR-associated protein Cas2